MFTAAEAAATAAAAPATMAAAIGPCVWPYIAWPLSEAAEGEEECEGRVKGTDVSIMGPGPGPGRLFTLPL